MTNSSKFADGDMKAGCTLGLALVWWDPLARRTSFAVDGDEP
jgi:hypothetical protein